MKRRKCFVANSSSSSYTCDVCGITVSGWDCSLSEYDMFECENGHIICEDSCLCSEELKKKYDDYIKNEDEDGESDHYGVPATYCPVCRLEHLTEEQLIDYLMVKNNTNKKELSDKIRAEFGTGVEAGVTFNNYINSKKKVA